MYARTESVKEQEFFRSSALKKIHEIPDIKIIVVPSTDIFTLVRNYYPSEKYWLFTPVYDNVRYLITGVRITVAR